MKKKECSSTIPLNSPESIGKFMTNNSPGDRTLLPTIFSFFGCLVSGLTLCNEQAEEDERKALTYKSK